MTQQAGDLLLTTDDSQVTNQKAAALPTRNSLSSRNGRNSQKINDGDPFYPKLPPRRP